MTNSSTSAPVVGKQLQVSKNKTAQKLHMCVQTLKKLMTCALTLHNLTSYQNTIKIIDVPFYQIQQFLLTLCYILP